MLAILALDIGTDVLPSLALGAEPPAAGLLDRPPIRHHLLDRRMLARVFGVLGPAEAVVEMAAFLAVFVAAGWRPGDAFPGGDVQLAAAGAAFTAVVLGQAANAFACRSTVSPPWRLGWAGNRLLIGAVAAELAMLAGFLYVAPIAEVLDQGPPPAAGYLVAILAIPAVLAADALHKAVARSSRDRRRDLRPYAGVRPPSQDRDVSFRSIEEEPWRVRRAPSSKRPVRAGWRDREAASWGCGWPRRSWSAT